MKAQQRLAIIGGRLETSNQQVFQKMKALSGGRIAIFSTASQVPEEVGAETVEQFESYGFEAELMPLFWDDRETQAYSQELVEKLEGIGHVFFTGGDQSRIVGAMVQGGEETPVLGALRKLHRQGGMIAGSSAGAAMMSRLSIMGGVSLEAVVYGITEDPRQMGMLLGEGLGFFGGGLVDQHFLERGRIGRLVVGMFAAGVEFGFGVDENTAMFVEGDELHVLGESGVVVIDAREAFASNYGEFGSDYCSLRMHFLDCGDRFSLTHHTLQPGPLKQLVVPSEISYSSPGHINRSAFGANTFLEVITRLAEGTERYRYDRATAYEPDAELEVILHMRRPKRSRSYSALIGESREYSISGFEFDLTCEAMSPQMHRLLQRERARYNARKLIHGSAASPESQFIAMGSGLLNDCSASLLAYLKEQVQGPIGIIAAASSDPEAATRDYMEMFERHGIASKDLNIRESNTLLQSQNEALLQEIHEAPAILFLGGAQERLVDTLLYRGENTRVLHAIIRAYRRGAALITLSGASSTLSEAMMSGGSSPEALQFGVSTDSWLKGVTLEPGFGFLRDAIVDQNLLSRSRLGRLLVACAEERERFGLGLLDYSGMVVRGEAERLEGIGAHGFVLLDLKPATVEVERGRFSARGVELRLIRPGQQIALPHGEPSPAQVPEVPGAIGLKELLEAFQKDAAQVNQNCGKDEACRVTVAALDEASARAVLDVEVRRATEGRRPRKELDERRGTHAIPG